MGVVGYGVGSIVGAAVNNLKPTATGATLSIFQTLPYRRYSTSHGTYGIYGILLERNIQLGLN